MDASVVMTVPKLSVILPVYNGAAWLREAVDSVLSQDFADFELIAINDGSTDNSGAILDAYADPRMRVVHQANAGLAVTLNRAVTWARADLIARQDADDICLPGRFRAQMAWMDTHPECVALGAWSRIMVGEKITERGHAHPTTNGELQWMMLFDNGFVHSTVMLRKAAALAAGNYPTEPARRIPEDFDLWSHMAFQGELHNLPEPFLIYREVPTSISREKADLIRRRVREIAIENVCRATGMAPSAAVADLVSLAHHEHNYLSPRPDWRGIFRCIRALSRHFAMRFPGQEADLRLGEQQIMQCARRVRLMRRPLLGRAVRLWERLA